MFKLWSTVQAGNFMLLEMQLCFTAGVTPLLFPDVQAGVTLAPTCRCSTCLGQQHLLLYCDS